MAIRAACSMPHTHAHARPCPRTSTGTADTCTYTYTTIIARQVSRIRANSFSPTRPVSRAWFSVQPVVNEMFATVHAAGSSLLGLFTSCTTFDSTSAHSPIPPPSGW
eukprot:scaffold3611_cov131-Isochrysis_galbana.AAC.3